VKDEIIDNVFTLIMAIFIIIFISYVVVSMVKYNPDKVDDFKTWQEELYEVNQRLDMLEDRVNELETEQKRLQAQMKNTGAAVEYIALNCDGLISFDHVAYLTGCVNCHWQEG
jgi:uncharacterized membrane protein